MTKEEMKVIEDKTKELCDKKDCISSCLKAKTCQAKVITAMRIIFNKDGK
jgi:hypothetical protein